jgi:hypothetical protein
MVTLCAPCCLFQVMWAYGAAQCVHKDLLHAAAKRAARLASLQTFSSSRQAAVLLRAFRVLGLGLMTEVNSLLMGEVDRLRALEGPAAAAATGDAAGAAGVAAAAAAGAPAGAATAAAPAGRTLQAADHLLS